MQVNKLINNLWAGFSRQKYTGVVLCMLCSIFFIVTNCEKQKNHACEDCIILSSVSGMTTDCRVASFMEGVSKYSNCCNLYVIRGIAMEGHEYGRKFMLVEDLKGNFPKNVHTFIAWGASQSEGIVSERVEHMFMYTEQSELIMLLSPVQEPTRFESLEDYTTLSCTHSVLRLSDGNVSGNILDKDGYIVIMKWKDFQKKLKKELKTNK